MDTQPEALNLYIYEQGRDGFVFPLDATPLAMFTTELDNTLFRTVDSPDAADFIIVPYPLGTFVNAVGLQNVAAYFTASPFFEAYPQKHVYFLRHDDSRPTGLPGVIFRVGANARYQDEQTIPLPYLVEDLGNIAPADFSALPYDTSFLGFAGLTNLRPRMADSVRAEARLTARVILREKFFGHIIKHSEEMKRTYRAEFLDVLAKSRTVLCPRGEGEGSIRFFEAMSAGRIPVMLADEYALPFADVIDYDAFMLRIPQQRVDETGAILADWLAAHTPAELQEMGRMARQAWLAYLSQPQLPHQVWRCLHRIKQTSPARVAVPPARQTIGKFWGTWQILFAHARALPRHSHIVAITAETAPVAALAHGLAAAQNTGTRLTVITAPETAPNFPADVVRLDGNPIILREKFPIRSVNFLFLSGFSGFRAMSHVLREWFITLVHGGTIVASDTTPDKSVVRAAEDFARETGYFIYSEVLSLPEETIFQLEYTAAAEFKQLFGIPLVPPVPVTRPPATPIARIAFTGDVPPAALPAVSLCMIVKNEEANLADCLRSVGDFAAEIIIVDTGSTDRTVEIARQFGAQVYHFPWVDDFAAARNESLRHATGEWIFWLDADDRIPASSLVKLKQAVASGRAEAYRCQMVSPLTGEHPAVNSVFYTLLFRNHRGVKFEGAIHESPTDSVVRQGLTLANTDITIEHHGYAGDAADLRRKAERNVRILQQCITAEPENLKWRYHLGVSLYQLEDFAGAVAQLEPIVMHPAPELNETNQVYRAHVLLLSAYANIGFTARAGALIAHATRRYPLRRHLWIAIGMHYLHQNRPRDAVSVLKKARTIPARTVEGEDWQPGVLESLLATAYRQWAAALLQEGDALSAAEIVQQAIAVAQQPAQKSEGWKLLAVCLQRLGQESEAMTAWQMAQQTIAEPA